MKYLRRTVLCCLVVLAGIFLPALNVRKTDYPEYDRRFVFVCPLQWTLVADGMKAADREYGTNTKLVGSSYLNLDTQISQIENAIRTKADGIITAAVKESDALRRVIQKARDCGIPVVLIDSDFEGSKRNCYIGTNNYEAGYLAGVDLAEAAEGSAQIAIVVSEMDAPNQKERVEGFYEVIDRYPDMEVAEILECHSDRLELAEKIPELLKTRPEIDALYLTEGYGGLTVGGMLKNGTEYPQKISIVAFDALEPTLHFVREGTYASVIAQDMFEEGYLAVKTLCQILDGETVEDTIYTGSLSVKKENCTEYQAGGKEEFEWYME